MVVVNSGNMYVLLTVTHHMGTITSKLVCTVLFINACQLIIGSDVASTSIPKIF